MSIVTLADGVPFVMVTKLSVILCTRSIVDKFGNVIVGETFSIMSDSVFPLRITIELVIYVERVYSVT